MQVIELFAIRRSVFGVGEVPTQPIQPVNTDGWGGEKGFIDDAIGTEFAVRRNADPAIPDVWQFLVQAMNEGG